MACASVACTTAALLAACQTQRLPETLPAGEPPALGAAQRAAEAKEGLQRASLERERLRAAVRTFTSH
jgi:hypothetical protein